MLYYPHILIREYETMATKAKTSSKARSAKTTRPASGAAARTTKKTTSVKARVVAAPVAARKSYRVTDDLNGSQVVSEMFGTFLLVSLVAASGGNAFLVGIALIAIAAMTFSVSGAHVNPAVTFGFFAMRKISAAKMVFYWIAQFVGAIAAIIAVNAFAHEKLSLSLSSFTQWDWYVFAAELIGAAVFMFGIAAAVRRGNSDTEKGVGIGLSLFVALLLSSALLQQAATYAQSTTDTGKDAPRITKLNGTTANPAVALSLKETGSVNPLTGQASQTDNAASRLTLEVIFGTLLGAALGGRLYMLLNRNEK